MKIAMAELRFLLLECFLIYSVVVFVACSAQANSAPEEFNEHGQVTCGNDEVFKKCSCVRSCCNRGNPVACSKECLTGCFCRDNLVRDNFGNCIKLEDCSPELPGKCGKDEAFFNCTPSCKNTCKSYNNPAIRCACGPPGCFCKEGLVQNEENGKCVKPQNCPGSPPGECKKDEQFYGNKPDCYNTCENYNNPAVLCAIGKPGCFCKEGLVKRKDGKCVQLEDCDKGNENCGKNEEVVDCAKPKWCNTCGIRGNCKLKECKRGCDCKEGYYRDADGICINGKHCPGNEVCHKDEVYNDCGTACPLTCENHGKAVFCTKQCVRGCFCKDGLVRRTDGQCIKPECCPSKVCRNDEVYQECGSACPATCENYGKPGNCIHLCVSGCYCKKGLVRRADGVCVIPERCPKKTCNYDEEYQKCGSSCPDTCDNYGKTRVCSLELCVPGCFCKKGLVRNSDFKCVIPEKCGKETCNTDEVFKPCGTACPDTCDNYGQPRPCTRNCVSGCFCKDGLVRHLDTKNCIPPGNCVKKNCSVNEEYNSCGSACPLTCKNRNSENSGCPEGCKEGCFCKKGFIRNRDGGICIPVELCPKVKPSYPICGEDEKFVECVPCANTCETYEQRLHCKPACKPGCTCNDGLVKRKDGKCVAPEQCTEVIDPKKCKDDEQYYECIPNCHGTCDTYNANTACSYICISGCYCKEGLVKNKDGKCVNPKDCNEAPKCGRNEFYSTCVNPCNNCEIKGNCAFLVCNKGCDCEKGFYRNEDGICIHEIQCPNKRCGRNEHHSPCVNPCNNCELKGNCAFLVCNKGCDCAKGFYRNEVGICIPESHCPKKAICGANEEYSKCGSGCPALCHPDGNGRALACPEVCKEGCVCKVGFIRERPGGDCISKEQCQQECGRNAFYSTCAHPCNSCEVKGKCEFFVCNEGCDCQIGHFRDKSGVCTPEIQCPNIGLVK